MAGWKARALDFSGAFAAVLMGTIVFGFGGIAWAILLIAFFVTSSALSLLNKRKQRPVSENFSKGSRRDWAQVLANGGVACAMVLVYAVFPQADFAWPAFAASLAAANADTWATELGILSSQQPRMLTGGKKVEKGTSGAITLHGLLAALAGSTIIAILALLFWQGDNRHVPGLYLLIIGGAGVFGSLVDSFIGATLQAIYYCPHCQKETERYPLHTCGSQTRLLRGWGWCNNDIVNLACTLSAALVAACLL